MILSTDRIQSTKSEGNSYCENTIVLLIHYYFINILWSL